MISNGHVTLDGLMFDRVGCVRAKTSICPHISDDIVLHVVVNGDLFELIGLGRTKNGILLCELRQDWFEFVAM